MTALPSEWFPGHEDGVITPLAQAMLYPYPAPQGDFFMVDGLPRLAPDGIGADALRGRVPVLSVGSNRAPLQLRRKFGPGASLPVTAAILHDVDIVFAASLSYYGAVPATGFPSQGARVALNIAWLDADQLSHMHDTEALGIAYDFIRYHPGAVSHGDRPDADDPVFGQPVHGYESRAGVLGFDGKPMAHAAIKAEGRVFPAIDEPSMLSRVQAMGQPLPEGDDTPLEDWITAMQASRSARDEVMHRMEAIALHPQSMPWDILDTEAGNPEAYL